MGRKPIYDYNIPLITDLRNAKKSWREISEILKIRETTLVKYMNSNYKIEFKPKNVF